jgi:predicted SnoaL-like aldol condensation-catalyzing enzyme
MMGMKAGKPFTMTSVDVARFKDGKAVEHWIIHGS